MSKEKSITYKEAGVDIDAGNALVQRIKPAVERTRRPEVLAGIGGFGGLFELPVERYRQPVLVSGTDGVGTKLKLAIEFDRHESVGIDLVAMCVNDVLTQGAEPLFLLDYYATARLDVATASRVIDGIATGCELAGAALLGGETAEMPGMYAPGDYDLAGFCVGVVEKDGLIDGNRICPGDVLIGLASSGPHANGYSLIRKLLEDGGREPTQEIDGTPLLDLLLEPTRIYVHTILGLLEQVQVHGLAHITGGGLLENIPRMLPPNTKAILHAGSWIQPPLFDWIQSQAGIDETAMQHTFNCGVGMVLCVHAGDADQTLALLAEQEQTAWTIGLVEPSQGRPTLEVR